MAGKGNRKSEGSGASRTNRGFSGHRFIEYDLTTGDKEILRAEYGEDDFPYSLIEDLAGQGYKYSLSYSDSGRCFISSLTDRREGSQFSNTTLSGRGATAAKSRVALLYRHYVVAQEDWNIFGKGGTGQIEDYG